MAGLPPTESATSLQHQTLFCSMSASWSVARLAHNPGGRACLSNTDRPSKSNVNVNRKVVHGCNIRASQDASLPAR
jgi:hypothetical protein